MNDGEKRCQACYPGDPMVQCDLRGRHWIHQITYNRDTPVRKKGDVVTWTGYWACPVRLPPRPLTARFMEVSPRMLKQVEIV